MDMGVRVIIGGPHATYFTQDCNDHSNWVVKGEGFRNFRLILEGELAEGIHFDEVRVAEGFPVPDRAVVYDRYPELAQNPIKSIFCSVGCPYKCTYCYAPAYNKMYGGFALNVRPVDEIIAEAKAIQKRWPLEMIYFQDDIFGFDMKWLQEFCDRWPKEVGVPWHCQIRLELTKESRLDLFRQGGCTGITLAIESGNDFLRRYVLLRGMPDNLIVEGIKKIQERGFTLRTEQILAVPFSDIKTDLETLWLNVRLNPEMAWTSILAPYGGTVMGSICAAFGFYEGNNDDLTETFFDRSVLRHIAGGRRSIEPLVAAAFEKREIKKNSNPIQSMEALHTNDSLSADVFWTGDEPGHIGSFQYMDGKSNDIYCSQTVSLQRIFNWLAKVPEGHVLGEEFISLPEEGRTWKRLGQLTQEHLRRLGFNEKMQGWRVKLATEMGYASSDDLPLPIAQNPVYFCFFPGSHDFAQSVLDKGVFDSKDAGEQFDALGPIARHSLFDRALYRLTPSDRPIACVR